MLVANPILATAAAALLLGSPSVAPIVDPAVTAAARAATAQAGSQTLEVRTTASVAARDSYGAELSPEDAVQALIGEGTQYDWARIVLYYGGWAATDAKVSTIAQWMRAENSPQSWWLRDNPLNNGFGTSSGNFLGRYANLLKAAENCAAAIKAIGGYRGILQALEGDPTSAQLRAAIIASSWATGHYGGGAHWRATDPAAVAAPAAAWGR